MAEEKEFEVGIFVQEARALTINATSQGEADDKYRAYLEEQGINYIGVQRYDPKGSKVTFREIIVIDSENAPEIILADELNGVGDYEDIDTEKYGDLDISEITKKMEEALEEDN
jgi:tRNA(Glu) U13 pseudouridine synthase TruD